MTGGRQGPALSVTRPRHEPPLPVPHPINTRLRSTAATLAAHAVTRHHLQPSPVARPPCRRRCQPARRQHKCSRQRRLGPCSLSVLALTRPAGRPLGTTKPCRTCKPPTSRAGGGRGRAQAKAFRGAHSAASRQASRCPLADGDWPESTPACLSRADWLRACIASILIPCIRHHQPWPLGNRCDSQEPRHPLLPPERRSPSHEIGRVHGGGDGGRGVCPPVSPRVLF